MNNTQNEPPKNKDSQRLIRGIILAGVVGLLGARGRVYTFYVVGDVASS